MKNGFKIGDIIFLSEETPYEVVGVHLNVIRVLNKEEGITAFVHINQIEEVHTEIEVDFTPDDNGAVDLVNDPLSGAIVDLLDFIESNPESLKILAKFNIINSTRLLADGRKITLNLKIEK